MLSLCTINEKEFLFFIFGYMVLLLGHDAKAYVLLYISVRAAVL